MQPNRKTEADLLAELRAITQLRGGLTAAAKKYGFSVVFISDVEKGKTPLTPRLAGAMGYRQVVNAKMYEPIVRKGTEAGK
jgi:hypothetical protein